MIFLFAATNSSAGACLGKSGLGSKNIVKRFMQLGLILCRSHSTFTKTQKFKMKFRLSKKPSAKYMKFLKHNRIGIQRWSTSQKPLKHSWGLFRNHISI